MYQLTKRGTERIERYCIDNVTFPELEKWDGYWRLILFDIPNTKKRARDNLAYKLCDVGCVQFQKSIYAYPHSCKEELEIISKFYFVKKYVVYLTVNDSNEFDVLRRKFKGVGA